MQTLDVDAEHACVYVLFKRRVVCMQVALDHRLAMWVCDGSIMVGVCLCVCACLLRGLHGLVTLIGH